ncbi:MAG: Hsp20 family protein [Paracoccaceae bacterium]|jgi:molecular chaperone IbpA|nr:Hsp20 family protein [Paracoccaceae bacterium]|tara:strand:+ start:5812 stop:6261 length:450 start_codon:yes stop_codon:yes gene_type:complete
MRHIDFTPIYRSTVGFDQFVDMFDNIFTNQVSQESYPPFNIEKIDEENYRISIASAGFSQENFLIEVENQQLTVGVRASKREEQSSYLHKGIAQRSFEKRFKLADHVHVTSASYEHGMLHIDLVKEVPEALKPRRIEISNSKTIASKAA